MLRGLHCGLQRGLHVSDVSGYLLVSAKSSSRDITCESIPGSLPPFYFSSEWGAEGGNEASAMTNFIVVVIVIVVKEFTVTVPFILL